jgi:predicted permease
MVYPLICYGVLSLFSFATNDIRTVMFIIGSCPVASIVLNFSEMLGEGQEAAADVLLLGTLSSIITMPIILQVL